MGAIRSRWLALALLSTLALPATGRAQDVVYDTGMPFGPGGAFAGNQYTLATRFILASGLTFDAVRLWGGTYLTSSVESVNWTIFEGANHTSWTAIASGNSVVTTSDWAVSYFDWTTSQYDFATGDIDLGAGTFWLALNLVVPDGPYAFWSSVGDANPGYQVANNNWAVANQTSYNAAFQLIDNPATEVVPEPVTMVLLGSGLFGVAGAARRRRREPIADA